MIIPKEKVIEKTILMILPNDHLHSDIKNNLEKSLSDESIFSDQNCSFTDIEDLFLTLQVTDPEIFRRKF